MLLCYILGGILLSIILLYACLELHYFLRMCLCVFLARFVKKRINILQETTVKGVCMTTDIDTLLYHMNNARYLRELDFARVDFYERTNLYRTICAKGGAVLQGACTIRYRRFIRTLSFYIITSKIVYWDDKSIYMEHRFITPKDNFVRAIALCKQRLIKCNGDDIINELLTNGPKVNKDVEVGKCKPQMPLEVERWNESNEISSANLRNVC